MLIEIEGQGSIALGKVLVKAAKKDIFSQRSKMFFNIILTNPVDKLPRIINPAKVKRVIQDTKGEAPSRLPERLRSLASLTLAGLVDLKALSPKISGGLSQEYELSLIQKNKVDRIRRSIENEMSDDIYRTYAGTLLERGGIKGDASSLAISLQVHTKSLLRHLKKASAVEPIQDQNGLEFDVTDE